MLEEIALKRQIAKDDAFRPPYCPNSKCSQHLDPEPGFAYPSGSRKILRFPYVTKKFACRNCRKVFSGSYFFLHYRQRRWGGNKEIFRLHNLGVSKREIARQLNCNEHMVRRRQIKMARWALLKHAKLSSKIQIREEIVYDGLENFSFSQFDPNNLNHAVGKRSLFTYDFNLCPINRKGRMSEAQILKMRALDQKYGRYPRDAIRTATKRIFERLFARAPNMVLYSDRHFQYRRVLELDMPDKKIEHVMVSSKVVRNYRNPLFAVNNVDLQARHNLAAFKRETIAFSKHEIAMQESFVLYMTFRNYLRPKFWGTHRSDPLSSKMSPAMVIGITNKILSFDEFFKERVPFTHVELHQDWTDLYLHVATGSRRTIAS